MAEQVGGVSRSNTFALSCAWLRCLLSAGGRFLVGVQQERQPAERERTVCNATVIYE